MSSHLSGPVVPEGPNGASVEGGLTDQQKEILRQVALDSIAMGLEEGHPLNPALEAYPEAVREPGAVFVTLKREGRLRGCIGSLTARRPLVEDVADNAYGAAFRDPRFPPLIPEEAVDLELHISLLTPPEPFPVRDREDLLERLRPGEDGLILEDPPRRSTFLPQVWDMLPQPQEFLGEQAVSRNP